MADASVSFGRARRLAGFTLVEILIVVSIISLLAGLILVGVQKARAAADEARVKTTIANWVSAIERYVQDEGKLPGQGLELDPERNDFPLLFNALCGEKRPKGPGGRNAPYVSPQETEIVVFDDTLGSYRAAERGERFDKDVEKFLLDPWGDVYVYRCNKGHSLSENLWMHNAAFDLYAKGANGKDETMLGKTGKDSDDIGNW